MDTQSKIRLVTLLLLVVSAGCSAELGVVRQDAHGGTLRPRGPLAPAYLLAREAMVDHCRARYRVDLEQKHEVAGHTERIVEYRCAHDVQHSRGRVEIAAR